MVVGTAPGHNGVIKLGFTRGQIVLELGYDDDVDEDVRRLVEELVGGDLQDEEYGDVVDAVLLWRRDGDGDLADALVDALTTLEDQGFVAVATPKVGHRGAVDAAELAEAADTAGLHASASVTLSPAWVATRLVAPKTGRR